MITSQILLPTKDNKGELLSLDYIQPILKQIALMFGGYTLQSGRGGYITDNNTLIEEDVTIVTIIGERKALKAFTLSLANDVKNKQSQESVLCYVDKTPIFI